MSNSKSTLIRCPIKEGQKNPLLGENKALRELNKKLLDKVQKLENSKIIREDIYNKNLHKYCNLRTKIFKQICNLRYILEDPDKRPGHILEKVKDILESLEEVYKND